MKRIALALLISSVSFGPALAQSCSSKAVDKDGKPLAGAAKTSFIKKCCTDSAKGSDGRALAGAALTSYMKKCEGG